MRQGSQKYVKKSSDQTIVKSPSGAEAKYKKTERRREPTPIDKNQMIKLMVNDFVSFTEPDQDVDLTVQRGSDDFQIYGKLYRNNGKEYSEQIQVFFMNIWD